MIKHLERRLEALGLALMSPWTRVVVELSVGAAVFAVSAVLAPDGDAVALFGAPVPMMCSYRARTGLPCPLCGATRAFVHLARGHVLTAWGYNPAASVLFVALVVTGALAALRVIRRDPTWNRPHPAFVAALAAGWVLFLYASWFVRA